MLVSDLITNHYWPEHALTLKPASLAQLRYSVQAFSRYLKREADLKDFDRLQVLGFLADRQQHVSPATVNKDRRGLLCLWRGAAEVGLCPQPGKLPKAKVPHVVPHTFTADELHRLIAAAAHSDHATFWRSLLLACYDTAGRLSALLAVHVRDVSFSGLTIHLAAESSKTGTEQILPIAADTAAAIAAQVLGRDRDELVWPWNHHRRRLFVHFRQLTENAGIKLPRGKAFHSIRRTSATLCARELGIAAASRQLGHSSLSVTARYVDSSRLLPMTWLPPRP